MTRDWSQHSNFYLQLFADCIPVRGAVRSAFCDLTRHEIITFPTEYYSLLQELQGKRIRDLLEQEMPNTPLKVLIRFLDFLDENELMMLVGDPSEFPPIPAGWDFPGVVQNAIIDVAATLHDFDKIFTELDALGCQHVQVRCFSDFLTLSRCRWLLEKAKNKSIVSVEMILKYQDAVTDEIYVTFVEEHPMLTSLSLHSAPESRCIAVDYVCPEFLEGVPLKEIRFTTQAIDSEAHCGIVTERFLNVPSVSTFFEAKSFNGCLNRKISVDSAGNIKNCPSMKDSYGNIRDTSLYDAVQNVSFKDKGAISKDQISICRDCEYRYVCSDCRAYLENPQDVFSKPLKCGYDPYTGIWTDWTRNPMKVKTAEFYGMELLLGEGVRSQKLAKLKCAGSEPEL